ncbi:GTP diphosphokinase [Aliiglaciecola sp. CAU 1673]|uniref:GTP diphosphokinase n=1 Tax=Aliiglaciecola sp. CAU 1673 TaxID=3032595 RepID=UPI0023DB0CB8|nr:GTP diphosphokinase [Aliiglaciecola sp. CAU 1673]MDF2178342.1 GTP diphosphokinase [Aliiglaciecola sp. CAU 1673]
MVSIRKVHKQVSVPFEEWLTSLQLPKGTADKLQALQDRFNLPSAGREMVEILHELHMDDETLQTALMLPLVEAEQWTEQQITDRLGANVWKLVEGVRRMAAIRNLHSKHARKDEAQIDNLRRMLLSMVEDVRAVVIKLAERVCALHQVKSADEETRVLVARECASIYAPLANRLGIGQLKWELEDMAFRFLHPETYKQIAKLLDEKREDRERYIDDFVTSLQAKLEEQQIRAQVYGRPKHIYSIWKKMQKKHLDFDELFDIRAVRIIADRLQDCYGALGTVHANWKHIPREFDDYIATPKPNGYQSIHTVIVGPAGRSVEIQIRTQQMHQDAELGVAAHWKYKEGTAGGRSGYEDKINWLRKILLWQEEMAESGDLVEELRSQVFDDRVYVFTPKGDVVDLPLGSTPLDFAYYIHSNVGHRCIGAKVSGRIVPFTYQLQTGDQVEILTGKQPNPSRDWMNPNLGYVHSSRARAKIHTWFKKLDRDKNLAAGKETLEKELQRVGLPAKEAAEALEKFNMASLDDLYVAIGGGDLRLNQVVNFLQQRHAPPPSMDPRIKTRSGQGQGKGAVVVEGVGNLMTQLAGCCQPLPGDPIVGYITIGRGVSVHREDCEQLAHLTEEHPERMLDVHWAGAPSGAFQTEVDIRCADRDGILRDITTVLANEKVGLLAVNSHSNHKDHHARIVLKIEVKDLNALAKMMARIKQINGIHEIKRIEH